MERCFFILYGLKLSALYRNVKKDSYIKKLTLMPSQFSRSPDITTSLNATNCYLFL